MKEQTKLVLPPEVREVLWYLQGLFDSVNVDDAADVVVLHNIIDCAREKVRFLMNLIVTSGEDDG